MAQTASSPTARRRAAKSPDAFRTISEVAATLDVPQHVLRFWESKFNQIKPLKRGGGRRYYRPEDVDLLRGIRHLLYSDGYTIKGVQKLLRENGARAVVDTGRRAAPASETGPAPAAKPAEGGEAERQSSLPLGSGGLSARQRNRLQEVLKELTALKGELERRRQGG